VKKKYKEKRRGKVKGKRRRWKEEEERRREKGRKDGLFHPCLAFLSLPPSSLLFSPLYLYHIIPLSVRMVRSSLSDRCPSATASISVE